MAKLFLGTREVTPAIMTGSSDLLVLNFGSSAASETITITVNNKSMSIGTYRADYCKTFLPVDTVVSFSISAGTLNLYVNNVSVRTGTSFTYTFSSNDSVTLQIDAGCCIPYYTKVNYYDGSEKTAEEVKIGDKLLGYNELTKQFEEVEVLNIIHKLRKELVTVRTENYEIEITPDHPILTDKGWAVYDLNNSNYKDVDKIKLTNDLKVFVSSKEYENITSIEYVEIETPIDTYTFNVTDDVNTFVAAGVVLHNAPC